MSDAGEPTEERATRPTEARHARLQSQLLAIVVALTAGALLLGTAVAVFGGDTAATAAVSEACLTSFKMGFGAIVGLLAARKD